MDYKTLVQGTLSGEAFVMVNKHLAVKLGFVEAGLLGELIATHKMVSQGINNAEFYKKGIEGEWFYLTQPSIESKLGIKRKEHDNGIKKIINEGLIIKKQKGLPAKSYYLIQWEKIAEMLSEPLILSGCTKGTPLHDPNVQPRVDEKEQLDVTKGTSIRTNNKNKDIKTNNNNKTFVNNDSFTKLDLIDIINSFYTELSIGRWTKQEWVKLTERLINEVLDNEGYKDIKNMTAYLRGCLNQLCYHYDYKHGRIKVELSSSEIPFYDWLHEV